MTIKTLHKISSELAISSGYVDLETVRRKVYHYSGSADLLTLSNTYLFLHSCLTSIYVLY
jgi:hypothetical protein